MQGDEIERLSYAFRASSFNILADKINSFNFRTLEGYICSGLSFLQNHISTNEYFDKTELVGSVYTGNAPLIEVTATLDDGFASKFKNLFYNGYPVEGIRLDRANENNAGIPPAKALPIANSYLTYLDSRNWDPMLKSIFPYNYDVFRYYRADWYDIMSKAATMLSKGNKSPKIAELSASQFGLIPAGNYTVNVKYVMPGGKTGTARTVNYNFTK